MTWLAHVLAAHACRTGGVIAADDPAVVPLAAMRSNVAWRGQAAVWMVRGLAAGGAAAWRTTSVSDKVTSPDDHVLVCVDSLAIRAQLEPGQLRPHLLLSNAQVDGYVPVSPNVPGLLAHSATTAMAGQLADLADDLIAGRIAEVEILSKCWQGHAGTRASGSAEAGVKLTFDALRWLRGLDEETALGLALAGQLRLARGDIWRLRVPVLSEGVVNAEMHFRGQPPFDVPTVTPIGAGDTINVTSELTQTGATVRLQGRTQDLWLDVDVSGARLVLSELALILPGLGPVTATGTLDPLSSYGSDPLDTYGPGAPG